MGDLSQSKHLATNPSKDTFSVQYKDDNNYDNDDYDDDEGDEDNDDDDDDDNNYKDDNNYNDDDDDDDMRQRSDRSPLLRPDTVDCVVEPIADDDDDENFGYDDGFCWR